MLLYLQMSGHFAGGQMGGTTGINPVPSSGTGFCDSSRVALAPAARLQAGLPTNYVSWFFNFTSV